VIGDRGQVLPLVALRWRMVRARRARAGLLVAALAVPSLALLAVLAGVLAPAGKEGEAGAVGPSVLLAFLILAVIAPLAAGGGTELYPPDQLVAFPIRPRTLFRGSLLLAPLNLAWLCQVLGTLGLTAYVIDGSGSALGAGVVTMVGYLAVVTVLGQGVAWGVVGVRQNRVGRAACWVALGALVGAAALLVRLGRLEQVIDHAPTRFVFDAALLPAAGGWGGWSWRIAALVGCGVAVVLLAERTCRWALGRPADIGASPDARVHRRRELSVSPHLALVSLTRRGVWRSRMLRRGALLLALLPGAVIAAADVRWDSLLLLPGLVAAGAGLLFGVNAFCLDGSGATWLSTLPHRPSVTFWARTQVVAEICAVTVLVAVTVGAVRAPAPTSAQLVCFVGAILVSVVRVTATCMRWSVERPHHAELRGPRDAPAPPGAMAVHSVRLAGSAAGVGIVLVLVSMSANPLLCAAVVGVLLLLPARSLARTARSWSDPVVRARVVATVGAG
jgi:hypothetical protein